MAKCIMAQGTMSGVGKSIIVAALCRIFTDDGYRVAPFKSQNMALNSFVTADGLEMGRAQVLQAAAARTEPDVRMNPILLKPNSDTGSQVVFLGKVMGDYPAKEYFKKKRSLMPKVLEAYDSLARENDIIVIEGAGSPAEINLKKDDIVNMGLAKEVNAPVLLVGDIDPGGVFAQLYGTIGLLEEEERNRIEGLIINKFRGDISLLKNGLDMLGRLTDKKVVGVIPYQSLDLEDEDSLSPRFENRSSGGSINISVIKLPHISNFTDFAPLERHPDINLKYISEYDDMSSSDIIIIPGTKNTLYDLEWLRNSGLDAGIIKQKEKGTLIIGICGGYQILGDNIRDGSRSANGLGLLRVDTGFSDEKITIRAKGRCASLFKEAVIEGYQIHMGITEISEGEAFCVLEDGSSEGVVSDNVIGTYMHGLFDTREMVEALIAYISEKKGMSYKPQKTVSQREHIDAQLDILADIVRKSLDIGYIYEVMQRYEQG